MQENLNSDVANYKNLNTKIIITWYASQWIKLFVNERPPDWSIRAWANCQQNLQIRKQ